MRTKYHKLIARNPEPAVGRWFSQWHLGGLPGGVGTYYYTLPRDENDPGALIEVPGYGAFAIYWRGL